MSVIAVDQTFMDRINSAPTENAPRLCGESDYLPLKTIWELIVALLSECQSPAVIMTYYLTHPKFTNPKFSPVSGFLLSNDAAENRTAIANVLPKEAVIGFYDLARGGNATFKN